MVLGKNAFFFTFDALLASVILLGMLMIITKYYMSEQETTHLSYLSQDMMTVFNTLKVGEMNNDWVNAKIADGNITNLNYTITEQIGQFWAEGNGQLANELCEEVTLGLVDNNLGYSMLVNNEGICGRNKTNEQTIISSRKMVSGIEKFKPVEGMAAQAHLTSIGSKHYSSYVYFGGFVGQGNVSVFIDDIPANATLQEMRMEMDAGSEFDLFINNQKCDGVFYPNGGNMSAETWDISYCLNYTIAGAKNNFTIGFDGNISDAYIGGGFIKIEYLTDQMIEDTSTERIWLPDIHGVINLYSSFYVPGQLNNITIYIHYYADVNNNSLYMAIGNDRVIEIDDLNGEGNITVGDENLTQNISYSSISQETVPIRIGFSNLSFSDMFIGNADIVLITDYSGSMKKTPDSWEQGNSGGNCESLDYTKRKTLYAKCADQDFVTALMENFTDNRIWPVWLNADSIGSYEDNPSSYGDVYNNVVPSAQGSGKTCLACSLNKAYNLLLNSTGTEKKKFVVLMSDAVPTHCPDDGCNGTSTGYGTQICEGICDEAGACDSSLIDSQCTSCTSDTSAIESTKYSAQRLFDDLDVMIFTVGFGPVDDCSASGELLQDIAEIGNGSFYNTTTIDGLYEIYETIAEEIFTKIDKTSQNVWIQGPYKTTRLYGDSYIEINYTSSVEPPGFGEISIIREENNFDNCTFNVSIPSDIRVVESKITSYSSEHWTDGLVVNNNVAYNLTSYNNDYTNLGDPFIVNIPPEYLNPGDNIFSIRTGDTYGNYTGCSLNNTFIYRGMIQSAVPYSDVLAKAEGCDWEVEFSDGSFENVSAPLDYEGSSKCMFTNANLSFDATDTMHIAAYQLFDQLDFNDDYKVDVNFNELNLYIKGFLVPGIPSMWGPSIIETRIW
ncbi:hypothetical protein KY345_05575 [Candidatus Woesearchaeota archaeon]|nr:hypothetical protein [Candidatus Woesearchaeota archaeon]